jgi:serine/threonine protein kinase
MTDMWSFGCIIAELLTGIGPWSNKNNNLDNI